jgi:hypothetical protein
MRRLLQFLAVLLFALAGMAARADNITIIWVSTAPSGSCTNGQPMQYVISTGRLYSCQARTWGLIPSGSAGSVAWGSITGTLANQTDLQTALNALLPLAGGTMTGPILNDAIGGGTMDGTVIGSFNPAAITSTTDTTNLLTINATGYEATLVNAAASGDAVYTAISNGDTAYWGVEGSAGANICAGTSPYALIFCATSFGQPIQFSTLNTVRATIDGSGNFGIGSNGAPSSDLFNVTPAGLVTSSKTSTATTSAPTVSSNAGTGSLTHGTDNSGIIVTGAASTATTLTFGVAWGTWASCTVSASTSTALPYVSAQSKTAATFTYVTTGTPTLYYNCNGD